MDLTKQEIMMYKLMSAIYNSALPVSFKGSMVLKAFLTESGFKEEIRHTVDIDCEWYIKNNITDDTILLMLQDIIHKNNISLEVKLFRKHGINRSAGFDLIDSISKEILFSMDIDIKNNRKKDRFYEIGGFKFKGVTPLQMISDKICVISSNKIFRRIKDLIDLYYFSSFFEYDYVDVKETIKISNKTLGDFNDLLNNYDELKHSYDKFRIAGISNKPDFSIVYKSVIDYIRPLL